MRSQTPESIREVGRTAFLIGEKASDDLAHQILNTLFALMCDGFQPITFILGEPEGKISKISHVPRVCTCARVN